MSENESDIPASQDPGDSCDDEVLESEDSELPSRPPSDCE
jgi:hypothetical protein